MKKVNCFTCVHALDAPVPVRKEDRVRYIQCPAWGAEVKEVFSWDPPCPKYEALIYEAEIHQ